MCKKRDRNWRNLYFKGSILTRGTKNSKFYCNHLTRWIKILYGSCKIFRGWKCIFWLRYLNFGICIEDLKNKTCWKNGKDLSNGAPKIKLWNNTKKRLFRFLPKMSASHGWKWIFVCQFPNPWAFRVSGMGCLTSKCEKVKITAPTVYSTSFCY